MSKFVSSLASALNAMLDYREALGLSRCTHESSFRSFDRYCAARYPQVLSLSKEMALGWIHAELEKPRSNIQGKATAVRLLGEYLSAIGQESYILPKNYVSQRKVFHPYIFTDAELSHLFCAMDTLPVDVLDTSAAMVAPVLFRLIYTCGLRPNEGRELRRANIDFHTGEILITKTKRKKERIVVMSDDMIDLCKEYDAWRNGFAPDSDFFFSRRDGQAYTSVQLECLFKRCWESANPGIAASLLPNIRVYDLRHRFASAILNRWLDTGRNLYAMLPYLCAYMGHEKMSETIYYIHILPENLIKSAGIDWSSFEGLIPEVRQWRG